MKKSTIIMLAVTILAAVVVAGCASTPKGPTDQELVAQTVNAWVEAMKAGDVDGVMKTYSESFTHYEWGDKEGLQIFLEDAKDMGYLDDLEVAIDELETEIEDGEATVYPIELEGAFGSVTIELVLKKEIDKWLVVGMTAEE